MLPSVEAKANLKNATKLNTLFFACCFAILDNIINRLIAIID